MAEDEKEPTWDDYLKTYLEPIKKEISELKQIADSQVTINEFYHKTINELEKKVDIIRIIIDRHKLGVKGEYYFLNKQKAIEKNEEEISSLRDDNQKRVNEIFHLQERQAELKERVEGIFKSIHGISDAKDGEGGKD